MYAIFVAGFFYIPAHSLIFQIKYSLTEIALLSAQSNLASWHKESNIYRLWWFILLIKSN